MARTVKHRISPWCHLPHREAFVNAQLHFSKKWIMCQQPPQSLRSHSTMAMLIFGHNQFRTHCASGPAETAHGGYGSVFTPPFHYGTMIMRGPFVNPSPFCFGGRRRTAWLWRLVRKAIGQREMSIYICGLCVCPSPVCACDAENARCGVGCMLLKPTRDGE